jgi:Nuclease-related domain
MADSIVAGIDGELIFRQELRELLGNGWTAFYNLPTGPGDIDCVLVGPSGLYGEMHFSGSLTQGSASPHTATGADSEKAASYFCFLLLT